MKFRTLGATALVVVSLSACASGTRAGSTDLVSSPNCSSRIIIEWDGTTNDDTPEAAIQRLLDRYGSALEKLEDDAPGADQEIPLDEDPVRLRIVTRGMAAALDELESAIRQTPAESDSIIVTGLLGDVPISEVEVLRYQNGTYAVDMFTTFGFTSDDPRCLAEERVE